MCACVCTCVQKQGVCVCVRVPLHSRRVNIKELPVHLNNRIVSFSIMERIKD